MSANFPRRTLVNVHTGSPFCVPKSPTSYELPGLPRDVGAMEAEMEITLMENQIDKSMEHEMETGLP